MKIILGSASKHRRNILEKMGYTFDVMSADIDEKAIRHEDPKELTMALAKAKAEALRLRIKEPLLLITADQVVYWNGQIREKPEDEDEARNFLQGYAQYPAKAINAVVVTNTQTGKQAGGIDITTVHFRPIPEEVIEKLIREGDVFSQGGAFSVLNPLLAPFIERVEGTVESAEGLPVELTQRLMKEAAQKMS